MRGNVVLIALFAALYGCGGGGGTGSVPGAGSAPAPVTTTSSSPDDPIDATAAAAAPSVAVAAASAAVTAPKDFFVRRGVASGSNTEGIVTSAFSHQDAGITSGDTSGSPVTGVRAFHAVYDPATIDLQPSGGLVQYLYAPTTKGPNGDCLEFGTAYTSSGGGTSADFYVFDFCTGGFELSVPIDATFMSAYTRARNGFTVYNAETIQAGSAWYALLYNYARRRWERVYATTGTAGNNAWSLFEFYFNPGPCPQLPTFAAQNIRFFDPTHDTWSRATPDDGVGLSQILGPPGSCFATPATYSITFPHPDYNWHVISTKK
jgi:hypothetical protein